MAKNLKKDEQSQNEKEEIKQNPYMKQGFLSKIPYAVKALFLKWWFFGCGFFFIFWGLSNFFADDSTPNGMVTIILTIVLGLFNGVTTDVMADKLLELMDSDKKESRNFMMFHNSKLYSLFINILYCVGLTYLTALVIDLIAFGLTQATGTAGPFTQGVEPVLFGVICLIFDMMFIGFKNLIVYLVQKHRKKDKVDV